MNTCRESSVEDGEMTMQTNKTPYPPGHPRWRKDAKVFLRLADDARVAGRDSGVDALVKAACRRIAAQHNPLTGPRARFRWGNRWLAE